MRELILEVELVCPNCASKVFKNISKTKSSIRMKCSKCDAVLKAYTLPDSKFWIIQIE